ncbi:GntR family transcriptional regulator [Lysinibacillus sp. NPDC097287]|uniref:GntR family transcriptional regulator n=1 Tax=Lysinibacillus sp. NPDC097287 TaxID=3364144 RepID=UPI00380C33E8
MKISLNMKSPIPLYQQLVQQIILEIANGNLRSGDQLPSIREMARQTNIHLHTVHKSYKELQKKGLIKMKPNSGAFILAKQSGSIDDIDLQQISCNLEQIIVEAYVKGISEEQLQQILNQISQKIISLRALQFKGEGAVLKE